MKFENKIVAIMNKNVDLGGALSALGHMSMSIGSNVNRNLLRFHTFVDANANKYPDISQIPFIVLRAKSNEIRKAVEEARRGGIVHSIFTNTKRVNNHGGSFYRIHFRGYYYNPAKMRLSIEMLTPTISFDMINIMFSLYY